MVKIKSISPYSARCEGNTQSNEFIVFSSEYIRVNPGEIKEVTLGFVIVKSPEIFIYPFFAYEVAKKGVCLLSHTLNEGKESSILITNIMPMDQPSVYSSIFGPQNKWECKKGDVLFRFKLLQLANY